jgi:site-specific DNA recombinase
MNKITALYPRISINFQKDEGQSIPRQKAFLKKEAQKLGLKNIQFFVDDGFSAKNTDRPQFQNLISKIKNGEVSTVMVYKYDRIARNLLDLLGFIELLKANNVEFISLKEKFDTSTPMGRATINILGSFAQFERETTVERVQDAMKSKHMAGEFTGGQPAFGFIIKDKKLFHHPEESAVVHLIYDKFEELGTFRGVCHDLNKRGYRTSGCKYTRP